MFYEESVLTYEGTDCLIWPYSRIKAGYGQMTKNGKKGYAHRFLCEDVNGPPPTPNHDAAHSCGKGHEGCVTKGHLSWKTRAQNKADELRHGTRNRGHRNGQAKITEDLARKIMSMKGVEKQKITAHRFGISKGTVSDIQCGKRWAWLP